MSETTRESVQVRVDPVERDAIWWAMTALERFWQEQASIHKGVSMQWSLPGWYDDLRRLLQRIDQEAS